MLRAAGKKLVVPAAGERPDSDPHPPLLVPHFVPGHRAVAQSAHRVAEGGLRGRL